MSAPISSFRKLSITDLMEGPGQARRGFSDRKGKSRAPPDEENDDSSSEDSSDEEDSETDDNDDERGKNAHVLALDHCRQYGSRYAFQMVDAEIRQCGIRIDETMKIPSCSCNEGESCRHTQWLLGQLSEARKISQPKTYSSPHAFIASEGLGTVCKTLKWEMREESDEESTDYPWALKKDYAVQQPEDTIQQDRTFAVRDILATFTTTATDDFRRDIFDQRLEYAEKDVFVPHDLEATVARLLLYDDDMFACFNSLVKRDERASNYFQNMALKAQYTLATLDRYCDGGPAEAGGDHDLVWCAQRLTDIVESISLNITQRQPLRSSSRAEAAKALISILSAVVKSRNHDVYQNLSWPRPRKHGEPQIDRNLYQRLIGSTSSANPSGGTFVIKALQELPEARMFVDSLEEIHALLDSVGWSAPKVYLEKLSGLITRLRGISGLTPSPPSSGKRAAGAMERQAKRMK